MADKGKTTNWGMLDPQLFEFVVMCYAFGRMDGVPNDSPHLTVDEFLLSCQQIFPTQYAQAHTSMVISALQNIYDAALAVKYGVE
jgi:hypothetical protein